MRLGLTGGGGAGDRAGVLLYGWYQQDKRGVLAG